MRFDESDLQVACSRGLAFDADISNGDPVIVERGARLLAESLDATHALGGTILSGALYGALGKYPQPLSPAGRANAVSVLRQLADDAARRGLRLGLEICKPL